MDARKDVEDDLKSCIRRAMKSKILFNPRMSGDFFKDRCSISSKYTRFNDEEDYLEMYSKKYEQGEFLATLGDGAFFQINYEFDVKGKKKSYLKKMNLCYLPSVTEVGEIEKEYIRIDYTNSKDNSFFHAYAHVHIGFKNCIRIPIDEVMYFSEFLTLILYLFYPNDFLSFCEGKYNTGNTVNESEMGKLTKEKILTEELENFFYWKINS